MRILILINNNKMIKIRKVPQIIRTFFGWCRVQLLLVLSGCLNSTTLYESQCPITPL